MESLASLFKTNTCLNSLIKQQPYLLTDQNTPIHQLQKLLEVQQKDVYFD